MSSSQKLERERRSSTLLRDAVFETYVIPAAMLFLKAFQHVSAGGLGPRDSSKGSSKLLGENNASKVT